MYSLGRDLGSPRRDLLLVLVSLDRLLLWFGRRVDWLRLERVRFERVEFGEHVWIAPVEVIVAIVRHVSTPRRRETASRASDVNKRAGEAIERARCQKQQLLNGLIYNKRHGLGKLQSQSRAVTHHAKWHRGAQPRTSGPFVRFFFFLLKLRQSDTRSSRVSAQRDGRTVSGVWPCRWRSTRTR